MYILALDAYSLLVIYDAMKKCPDFTEAFSKLRVSFVINICYVSECNLELEGIVISGDLARIDCSQQKHEW